MAQTISSKVVRFGAVEFPVNLKAASSKADVKLQRAHPIYSGEGKKQTVRYEQITRKDLGAETGEVVTTSDAVKGIWNGDEFKPLSVEDLAAIAALGETEQVGKEVRDLKVLEIQEFIPLKDVPLERSEGCYFLAPMKGGIGAKPMKLLYEALKAEKAAGTFKFVVKGGGRQKLGVVHASGGKLLVNVLAFASDFVAVDADDDLTTMVKPEKVLLDHMRAYVKALSKDTSESLVVTAKDTAVEAKAEALEHALEGKSPKKREVTTAKPTESNADILLDALRANMKAVAA